ncbi:hypothetical protein IGS75_13560 (plasmid) [Gluconobacter sphaericus]|uniref:hypothetical protein n=1 Tax=Gluconobacter sphaericus TaxID=574987 RepID=UPI001924ACEF|nr:hypothetical protein [Gluconobacter sphaericus]QQX92594.1 hypothetical protein IGS75_13560 [Gluconobacter sphaericus]
MKRRCEQLVAGTMGRDTVEGSAKTDHAPQAVVGLLFLRIAAGVYLEGMMPKVS